MVMFAKHPKVADYDLSSVEYILCGAAPLSEDIEMQVKNKMKLKAIQQGKYAYTFDFITGSEVYVLYPSC